MLNPETEPQAKPIYNCISLGKVTSLKSSVMRSFPYWKLVRPVVVTTIDWTNKSEAPQLL